MNIFNMIFKTKNEETATPITGVANNDTKPETIHFGTAAHIRNLELMWEKTVALPIPDSRDLIAAEIFSRAAKRREAPKNARYLEWLKTDYPALFFALDSLDYNLLPQSKADLIWDEFPKVRAAYELAQLSKSQGSLLSLIEDDLDDEEGGKAPSPAPATTSEIAEPEDEEEEYPIPKF